MRLENPSTGGKVHVSNGNAGFGDYHVSTSNSASPSNSTRVLAGRQSGSSQSSLYVQVVSDTIYNNLDGQMNVTPIEANTTMNMDALEGMMMYSFSNYRVLPRNNDDFVGINVSLDSTNLPGSDISVVEYENNTFMFYPNPATDVLHIQNSNLNRYDVKIFNMMGQEVFSQLDNINHIEISLGGIKSGAYIMHIQEETGKISTSKIIIQ